ncbi:MAG: methyltransferase domain-containing protein [Alphaproteobacteria bacterium]
MTGAVIGGARALSLAPADSPCQDEAALARKAAILRSFDAAADTYDRYAGVQHVIAERLAERIAETALGADARILEIGCGTGFLSEALRARFPDAHLLLTDLSGAMVRRCRERLGSGPTCFAVMDGEEPSVAGGFDLVASSAVFQWFLDLPRSVAGLARCLRPGGRLAFASLGHGTFAEWRAAHARLGWPFPGLVFPDAAGLRRMMAPEITGLRIESLDEERLVRSYPDTQVFLRALQGIGAALPAGGVRPYTAGRLRRLMRAADGNGTGLSVTYHVFYGALVRE